MTVCFYKVWVDSPLQGVCRRPDNPNTPCTIKGIVPSAYSWYVFLNGAKKQQANRDLIRNAGDSYKGKIECLNRKKLFIYFFFVFLFLNNLIWSHFDHHFCLLWFKNMFFSVFTFLCSFSTCSVYNVMWSKLLFVEIIDDAFSLGWCTTKLV